MPRFSYRAWKNLRPIFLIDKMLKRPPTPVKTCIAWPTMRWTRKVSRQTIFFFCAKCSRNTLTGKSFRHSLVSSSNRLGMLLPEHISERSTKQLAPKFCPTPRCQQWKMSGWKMYAGKDGICTICCTRGPSDSQAKKTWGRVHCRDPLGIASRVTARHTWGTCHTKVTYAFVRLIGRLSLCSPSKVAHQLPAVPEAKANPPLCTNMQGARKTFHHRRRRECQPPTLSACQSWWMPKHPGEGLSSSEYVSLSAAKIKCRESSGGPKKLSFCWSSWSAMCWDTDFDVPFPRVLCQLISNMPLFFLPGEMGKKTEQARPEHIAKQQKKNFKDTRRDKGPLPSSPCSRTGSVSCKAFVSTRSKSVWSPAIQASPSLPENRQDLFTFCKRLVWQEHMEAATSIHGFHKFRRKKALGEKGRIQLGPCPPALALALLPLQRHRRQWLP